MEWATYQELGGKPVLRFERRLAHAPEKVFRAISDPAELGHWFPAAVRTELRAGAAIEFDFGDDGIDAPAGAVLELDPPKLLVFTWGDDVLRWEIVPEGAGSRLVFTHTLSGDGMSGGRPGTARNAAGWDVCLGALAAQLDGAPAPDVAWFPLFEGYVERFGLAEGEARARGETIELRFERDVVQTPAQVWEALTDGAAPRVGEPAPRRFGHAPPGRVTAVEPERVLAYAAEPAGRVTWELEPRVPGSLIVLRAALPAAEAGRVPAALAAWQVHLELLVAALQGVERCWPDERVAALEARYAARGYSSRSVLPPSTTSTEPVT